MERKIAKEHSLKTFFFKFLIQVMLSWLAVCVIFVGILELLLRSHVLLPANTIEQDLQAWLTAVDASQPFSLDTLPNGVDYACFSAQKELLSGTLKKDSLSTASSFALDTSASSDLLVNQRVYKKIVNREQTLILTYQITATFSSPALRRLFPNVEPLLFLLFLLLFLSDLFFFILCYAKKLEKELTVLQYASTQIGLRNLDFEAHSTGITEINRILSSLLLLRDELKHSLTEQWQLQQQKREQLSCLAHDIKTPLTIIKGNAELLAESTLDATQKEYNSFILENTLQIQNYVSQMLEISKKQFSPASTCTLDELLAHIEKSARILCREKQLTFSLQKENLPEQLRLPEDPMMRILTNILDNAVQYSPKGGAIVLKASLEKNAAPVLHFSITDEGVGFSKEALRCGTTAFYRADDSRSSREHFGMGLAIVKNLVKESNGSLLLSNRPESGAQVTVILPYDAFLSSL